MKPLYTTEEFKKAKYKDKLPCECYRCGKTFYKSKNKIKGVFNSNNHDVVKYCSRACVHMATKIKLLVTCKQCGKEFLKSQSQIKQYPNHFCSHSCSATYNNKRKTTGTRRSKLEVWLESQLLLLYPNLEFHFNRKDTINSELDIYIPSLKLAFELNGIYHYEPIHGDKKLKQTQNNDNNKFSLCLEHNISLCIIDTSTQIYVKPSISQKYLDIIINIIKERLLNL